MEDNHSKKTADAVICPCCGESTIIDLFDICPICGWEHNLTQLDDPDFAGGPNILSLNQTSEWFRIKRQMDTGYTWKANAKKDGNPTLDDLCRLRDLIKEK
ncbi:MAG: CPCC family cysteine-rich protein [Rhodospirillaceae bacterium]|nr:CPCC family cysteine-rich protein [Rhodospirillaceae bacterium]